MIKTYNKELCSNKYFLSKLYQARKNEQNITLIVGNNNFYQLEMAHQLNKRFPDNIYIVYENTMICNEIIKYISQTINVMESKIVEKGLNNE